MLRFGSGEKRCYYEYLTDQRLRNWGEPLAGAKDPAKMKSVAYEILKRQPWFPGSEGIECGYGDEESTGAADFLAGVRSVQGYD